MEGNTKMKKAANGIIVALIVILAGIGIVLFQKQSIKSPQQSPPIENIAVPVIELTIFDGEKTATYSSIVAQTPYEALTKIASQEQIPVQTKQYDFGVFVEAIAGIENTKDKTWIYFVNGKSGEVASDKYVLKQNDTVEWKYTTPIY